MILISFTLALIAIVFGAQLLAQSNKDNLGALYKYLAWFIMIMGFLVLLCDGARALICCCHRGDRMMNQQSMIMDRDDGMMRGGSMWMMHHRRGGMNGGNNNCCDGMMNCNGNSNCCDGMMGGNCCDGMMNCGGNSKCSDGMMNCTDGGKGGMGAGCPMMGAMKDKSDSTKAKSGK